MPRNTQSDKRRQERRQTAESMLVIGAGMQRTGTSSIQRALEILGYRPYHFYELLRSAEHSALWAARANSLASARETLEFLGQEGFNASLAYPTIDLLEEQMRLYPEAKVLLSVRDGASKWARSWRLLTRTNILAERPFSIAYPNPIPWILRTKMAELHAVRCAYGTQTLGLRPCELYFCHPSKPEGWLEGVYERHNARVEAVVPPNKLLVFNAKQGWEPLCKFLGTSAPDVPFPQVADGITMRRATVIMQLIVYAWIPALLLFIWEAHRFCRRVWVLPKKTKER